MKRIILVALAFLVAACAFTGVVYLKNPQTGQTVQCGPYTRYGNIPAAQEASIMDLRRCVGDYQRQGYERVPKPN